MHKDTFKTASILGFKAYDRTPNFKRLYTAANDDEIRDFFENLYELQRKEALLSWINNDFLPISEMSHAVDADIYNKFQSIIMHPSHANNVNRDGITIFGLSAMMWRLLEYIDFEIIHKGKKALDRIDAEDDAVVLELKTHTNDGPYDFLQCISECTNADILSRTTYDNGMPESSTVSKIFDFLFDFRPITDGLGKPDPDIDYYTVIPDDFGQKNIYLVEEADMESLTKVFDGGTCGITHNAFSEKPRFEELYTFD